MDKGVLKYILLFRYELEAYQTDMGVGIGRANVTSIAYDQSGTYTCKAKESDGSISATRTISVTVLCRK